MSPGAKALTMLGLCVGVLVNLAAVFADADLLAILALFAVVVGVMLIAFDGLRDDSECFSCGRNLPLSRRGLCTLCHERFPRDPVWTISNGNREA